ncbi:hypothetical protein PAPYR_2303 [Paratrimastix pyriformis]|uniref:Uncharacterized protein n=1 Tax=Paratrimastix pyriformis TaxID=342808 RepID=A0ABQ8UV70_9EUKA|nr:hypothetical protein PAPYR_2303 [Paratrimastix pyriformis]
MSTPPPAPPGSQRPERLSSLRRDPTHTLGGVQKQKFVPTPPPLQRRRLPEEKETEYGNVDELLSGDLPELLKEPQKREKRKPKGAFQRPGQNLRPLRPSTPPDTPLPLPTALTSFVFIVTPRTEMAAPRVVFAGTASTTKTASAATTRHVASDVRYGAMPAGEVNQVPLTLCPVLVPFPASLEGYMSYQRAQSRPDQDDDEAEAEAVPVTATETPPPPRRPRVRTLRRVFPVSQGPASAAAAVPVPAVPEASPPTSGTEHTEDADQATVFEMEGAPPEHDQFGAARATPPPVDLSQPVPRPSPSRRLMTCPSSRPASASRWPPARPLGDPVPDAAKPTPTPGPEGPKGQEPITPHVHPPTPLSGMPSGHLGKLQLLQSGRVRLVVGPAQYLLEDAAAFHFHQQLLHVQRDQRVLTTVGDVVRRMVCVPDFAGQLLPMTGAEVAAPGPAAPSAFEEAEDVVTPPTASPHPTAAPPAAAQETIPPPPAQEGPKGAPTAPTQSAAPPR